MIDLASRIPPLKTANSVNISPTNSSLRDSPLFDSLESVLIVFQGPPLIAALIPFLLLAGGSMNDNAKAMVLASFAADSLALGAHWIYDTEKIVKDFGRVDRLLAPPKNSYHPTKKRGEFTHYGDQTLLLLQSVSDKGRFDLEHFATRWRQFSSTSTGYLDHATKETLLHFSEGKAPGQSGAASTDLGGPARIAPLVYRYRDDLPSLLAAVRQQTAMTHTGPGVAEGAEFLARTTLSILHGASIEKALADSLEQGVADIDLDLRLRKAMDTAGRDTGQTIKEFGQMCAMNAALPGVVHLVLRYGDNLREGLVENVMAGGDSAARGLVTGMLLGAAGGREAIPVEWLEDMTAFGRIRQLLDDIS